jgi:hypothetical protein
MIISPIIKLRTDNPLSKYEGFTNPNFAWSLAFLIPLYLRRILWVLLTLFWSSSVDEVSKLALNMTNLVPSLIFHYKNEGL